MARPDKPLSLNLAQIVHRLMTNPRGWRIDEMLRDLNIKPRTYRKYRGLLQDHFEHLFDRTGRSRITEVKDGDSKYLRLKRPIIAAEQHRGFLAHLAGHWFARRLLNFASDTELSTAVESAYFNFVDGIKDKPYWLGHILANTDRMLHHVVDAPKDYSGADTIISSCLSSLFYTVRIRIEYRAATREASRIHTVCPLTLLHWKSGLYLVAAYTPDAHPYLFAIDRMIDVELTNVRFRYPERADYDPSNLFEGRFGIFEESGSEPTDVALIFSDIPWLHRYLTERTWHPTQVFEQLSDGRLQLTFTVGSMVEVWPWIRSFGGDVAVVKP
ncbi:MAG: WYL domain-containing protein [Myxococcota bacterium]|nr:WYL domain-containing protein [Myxococcota bacterium]